MKRQNLQAQISDFIAGLRYEDLPTAVVQDAKYRVLDWLGSALAGSSYKPALIVTKMVLEAGGAPQATVLQSGMKVPMAQAALANGIMGHVVEYDDGHRLAIAHPGAVTVPTALAVAESLGRSGKEVLTAIVAGYEVLIRLGASINPSHYQIWHTTGTCGTFAAAATAARLLKLDPARTQMCLGVAGTMACGLQETFGTHAKPLNVGHACQSGIQAGLLAMEGFTGPEDILLGPKGFVTATTEQFDSALLDQIDERQYLSPTAYYKVYASCGHTNSPLDALFAIMKRHNVPPPSIRAVRIATYRTAVQLTGEFKNQSEEEAKFSLPYCVAVALLHKRVTLAEFAPGKLQDPEVVALARKIHVSEDAGATVAFPRERRADVAVEFQDGQVIEEKILFPLDTPDYKAVGEKFLSLAEMTMDAQQARTTADIVLNLEQCPGLDRLMENVRSKPLLTCSAPRGS